MTTIDIDEATRNAILAALDERAARLEQTVARAQVRLEYYQRQRLGVADRNIADRHEDTERVLVWNVAALHETNMARLQVAEAGEPVATLAEAVPWEPAKSYHDQQAR